MNATTLLEAGAPASADATEGPTRRLSRWLADIQLDGIPERVIERAKHVLLDGVACALVGAQLPWSRRAVAILADWEGDGECALIGCGRRVSASTAAVLNSAFIQGFELDDFHPLAPLHSASLIVPALLAAAHKQQIRQSERFLLAAICGFETGPRVGHALHGAQMLSRGWHSGAVFGTHAAAAAAGKLIGLDQDGFEDALGLAGTQSGGLMAAQFEAMSKRMHHGFAARAGLTAAVLAQGGYTGIKRVFEREYGGFLSTFGEGHEPDARQIALRLGSRWETEAIVIKRHAVMGGLQLAVDGMLQIRAQTGLHAEEIERIDISVADAVFHHGGWAASRPLTPIGAQMNMAYAVAVAALDGVALAHQFVTPRLDADDVWTLMARIAVHHDPAFDQLGPMARGATRLVVHFRDGRTPAELLLCHPQGQPIPETTNAMIVHKFRLLTEGLMPAARRDRIEQLVLGLDRGGDIEALIDVLADPVGSIFSAN
jgi:aconitate decarboxylase